MISLEPSKPQQAPGSGPHSNRLPKVSSFCLPERRSSERWSPGLVGSGQGPCLPGHIAGPLGAGLSAFQSWLMGSLWPGMSYTPQARGPPSWVLWVFTADNNWCFLCGCRESSIWSSRSWASCSDPSFPSSCGINTSWVMIPPTATSWEGCWSSSTASARWGGLGASGLA